MPLYSASLNFLLFLAAFGGLLILLLRRHQAGLFFSPQLAGAHISYSAMQAPEAIAQPRVKPESSGRSSSGTPFPPTAQGEWLLVVDDEPSVCELLSTVLTNHGYQVATARNGLEGAKYYAAHQDRVALVISDMHMPHSGGKSFAELLRVIRPDTKILFMSGMDNTQVSNPPLPYDPFLLKPFKPAVLLETIHRLLHPEATLKA